MAAAHGAAARSPLPPRHAAPAPADGDQPTTNWGHSTTSALPAGPEWLLSSVCALPADPHPAPTHQPAAHVGVAAPGAGLWQLPVSGPAEQAAKLSVTPPCRFLAPPCRFLINAIACVALLCGTTLPLLLRRWLLSTPSVAVESNGAWHTSEAELALELWRGAEPPHALTEPLLAPDTAAGKGDAAAATADLQLNGDALAGLAAVTRAAPGRHARWRAPPPRALLLLLGTTAALTAVMLAQVYSLLWTQVSTAHTHTTCCWWGEHAAAMCLCGCMHTWRAGLCACKFSLCS
jgi:hypothetical protein